MERALQAELTTHLGYAKGDFGTIEIAVSAGSRGELRAEADSKGGETRFVGFDDKILSLYARGMTTREIQGHLEEMYQVEVIRRR